MQKSNGTPSFTTELLVSSFEASKKKVNIDVSQNNKTIKEVETSLEKQIQSIKTDYEKYFDDYSKQQSENEKILKSKTADQEKSCQEKCDSFDKQKEESLKASDMKLATNEAEKNTALKQSEKENNANLDAAKTAAQDVENKNNESLNAEKERYANVVLTRVSQMEEKLAQLDQAINELNTNSNNDLNNLKSDLTNLQDKFLKDQNAEKEKTAKEITAIEEVENKLVKEKEKELEKLANNHDAQKSKLEKEISKAADNRAKQKDLPNDLKELIKTYENNVKVINDDLNNTKASNLKTIKEKNSNLDIVLEELRVKNIEKTIELQKQIKEKQLRLATDLSNKEKNKMQIQSANDLLALKDENRIEELLNTHSYKTNLVMLNLNNIQIEEAFKLHNNNIELDYEVQTVEEELSKAQINLTNELNKKQESTKQLLEIQNLQNDFKLKSLNAKLALDIKKATMHDAVALKQAEAHRQYQVSLNDIETKGVTYKIEKLEVAKTPYLNILDFQFQNFQEKIELTIKQQEEEYQSTQEILDEIYKNEVMAKNAEISYMAENNKQLEDFNLQLLSKIEQRHQKATDDLLQVHNELIQGLKNRLAEEKDLLDLHKAKILNFDVSALESVNKYKTALGDRLNDHVLDYELAIKTLADDFANHKVKLQSQFDADIAICQSEHEAVIKNLTNELVAFEKDINDKMNQAIIVKNDKLKVILERRNQLKEVHDQVIKKAEADKEAVLKTLAEEMAATKKIFSSEISKKEQENTKTQNSLNAVINANEANYQKELKNILSFFVKEQKLLITKKKELILENTK